MEMAKEFHRESKRTGYAAGVRSVFYAIWGEYIEQGRPTEFELSDRQLKTLSGLKSVSSAHEAKRTLKNLGWVDFWHSGNTTKYRLLRRTVEGSGEQSTEHLGEQEPNTERVVRADSNTRERAEYTDIITQTNQPPPPPPPPSRAREEKNSLEATLEYWDAQGGGRLNWEHRREMAELVERYGLARLKVLIKEAADSNRSRYGFGMKYFRAVIAATEKGAKRNERQRERNERREVDCRGCEVGDNEPWSGY